MDPTCVFNSFTFFERILYKSNCIIFIFSWCATHTKIRSKLVVIVMAWSQKITLWGPQRTPLGILRVNCVLRTMCVRARWSRYGRLVINPQPLSWAVLCLWFTFSISSRETFFLFPSLLSKQLMPWFSHSSDLNSSSIVSVLYVTLAADAVSLYGLRNSAVSRSNYTSLEDRMINEYRFLSSYWMTSRDRADT